MSFNLDAKIDCEIPDDDPLGEVRNASCDSLQSKILLLSVLLTLTLKRR